MFVWVFVIWCLLCVEIFEKVYFLYFLFEFYFFVDDGDARRRRATVMCDEGRGIGCW